MPGLYMMINDPDSEEAMRLVTIADVAKRANVSMMTVSRVINNSGHVSEQTRKRVQEAIDLLSYRPNMMAKGLATGRSKLIAYVMSDLSNPFFSLVSKGIEPNRIYTEGKGPANPVKQCPDPSAKGEVRNFKQLVDCLQPNRRVEVEVVGTRPVRR